MKRDLRPRIMDNALAHPDLSATERIALVALVRLPGEYVDGQRRDGSQGMDARGNFALHYDYLARALHTSPENAKKQLQRMTAKGLLSKRWNGTFGRPAAFQALDVRGDKTYRITLRRFVPPYGENTPTSRRDTVSPLAYRDLPTDIDYPAAAAAPPATAEASSSSYEGAASHPGGVDLPADWWQREPPDLDQSVTVIDREAGA